MKTPHNPTQPTAPAAMADKPARRYLSPLRKQQHQLTRAQILSALGDHVLACNPRTFSIAEVAARAGVSVRTVYRHFGDRQQLLAALQEEVARRIAPPPPQSLEALIALVPELFGLFDQHAGWMQVLLQGRTGTDALAAGRPERLRHFAQLTAPLVAHLPAAEARATQATIKHLVSAQTWLSLREEYGLHGQAAGTAVARLLSAAFDALRVAAAGAEDGCDRTR